MQAGMGRQKDRVKKSKTGERGDVGRHNRNGDVDGDGNLNKVRDRDGSDTL